MDWRDEQMLESIGDIRRAPFTQSEALIFDQGLIAEKDYWIELLSREAGEANLRLDHPRAPGLSPHRESVPIVFSETLQRRLAEVTGGAAFLSYTILLGAAKICLHNYTGSGVIIVG